MTDKDRLQPRVSPEGTRREEARQRRLARALRENLAKRKAQARARDAGDPGPAADRDPNR